MNVVLETTEKICPLKVDSYKQKDETSEFSKVYTNIGREQRDDTRLVL